MAGLFAAGKKIFWAASWLWTSLPMKLWPHSRQSAGDGEGDGEEQAGHGHQDVEGSAFHDVFSLN